MRTRGGAAALEFALTLPAFLLLLFAIMDYGWLFYHRAALDSAANTGCRAGSLIDPGIEEADMAAVQDEANSSTQAALEGLGIPCGADCSVAVEVFGVNPARSIRCTVQLGYDPLVGAVLDPLTLEALQVSRLEYQR